MTLDPTTVPRVATIVAIVLFALLVLFQAALAAGVPWGRAAYGGQTAELPAHFRIASVIAVLVWTAIALVVARRGGLPVWAPAPDSWLPVLVWIVVGLLVVAVIMNAVTPSAIERAIWLPFTLLLLAATATVALTGRGVASA